MCHRLRRRADLSRLATPLAALLIIVASTSMCQPRSKVDLHGGPDSFAEEAGLSRLNSDLEVTVPEPPTTMYSRIVASALVMNRGSSNIRFPAGYGTRLFMRGPGTLGWVEIRNLTEYLGSGEVLEPRTSGFSNWAAAVSFSPDLPPSDQPIVLRVLVVGELMADRKGTGESTGGYVDVTINP